jgi:hypothetical protein
VARPEQGLAGKGIAWGRPIRWAGQGSCAADLLDGWAVVREWGRVRADVLGELALSRTAAERLAARKRGRGYR